MTCTPAWLPDATSLSCWSWWHSLHTQATIGWLRTAGASVDLREQAAALAREAAEERDTPATMGLAAAGAVRVMLSTGAFDLAQAELDSVSVPTTTPQTTQLAGMLALYRAEVAAADRRPDDVGPALDYAAELAARTGEGNAYWLGFGPSNTGFWASPPIAAVASSVPGRRHGGLAGRRAPGCMEDRGPQVVAQIANGPHTASTPPAD